MSALVREIFGLALFSTTPGNLLPKHSFHLSSKRLQRSNAPPYPELDALELLWSNSCHADRGTDADTAWGPGFNGYLCEFVRRDDCLPRPSAILSAVCSGDCAI